MILNVRNNSFVLLLPENFFADEVKEKYKAYYKSLILPYDTIEDFMASTVQQIEFPSWTMQLADQTRLLGKKQEYKSSKPIADLFTREISLTMKLTDAYLNYFMFLENSLNFLDFDNRNQTLGPIRLLLLNNEGYAVSSLIFNRPILKSQTGIKLSYSSVTPEFNTFEVKFQYLDFKLEVDFE
jgi:hypothetical protein